MKQPVVVKANNLGLIIVLDPDIEFNALCEAVGEKFKKSAKFFGNSDVAVAFEGRKITPEEEGILTSTIMENASFKIACIIDRDPVKEKQFKESLERFYNSQDISFAKIYKGSFRSGQMMEFDTGAIILGDINPGARVISKGSIIVLGALNGEAEAGSDGNDTAFVMALSMNPIQLRIGSKIARAADDALNYKKKKKIIPQVAYVKEDNIYIEDLDKNVFDCLNI